MAKCTLSFATISLIFLAAVAAQAQQKYAPTKSECIQQFYDSEFYNWLSYRNTCDEDLYVSWVSREPGLNGANNIRAGHKENTGWSAQEIRAKGGLIAYACPTGYLPVDPEDNPITSQVRQYRCKYEGD